jgi:hypothetical protein
MLHAGIGDMDGALEKSTRSREPSCRGDRVSSVVDVEGVDAGDRSAGARSVLQPIADAAKVITMTALIPRSGMHPVVSTPLSPRFQLIPLVDLGDSATTGA